MWIGIGLAGAFCWSVSSASIEVHEHNGYSPLFDYHVTFTGSGLPRIQILRPSRPVLGPYDFDCYYPGNPNVPAPIRAITAIDNVGTVEIMVRGHGGVEHGASALYVLELDANGSPGVRGVIKELRIGG
jgi:hypothetical protein